MFSCSRSAWSCSAGSDGRVVPPERHSPRNICSPAAHSDPAPRPPEPAAPTPSPGPDGGPVPPRLPFAPSETSRGGPGERHSQAGQLPPQVLPGPGHRHRRRPSCQKTNCPTARTVMNSPPRSALGKEVKENPWPEPLNFLTETAFFLFFPSKVPSLRVLLYWLRPNCLYRWITEAKRSYK